MTDVPENCVAGKTIFLGRRGASHKARIEHSEESHRSDHLDRNEKKIEKLT
jgi:hypothetical protein